LAFFGFVYRNYCTKLFSLGGSSNGGSPSGMCESRCGEGSMESMSVSSGGNSGVCVSSDMCGNRCGNGSMCVSSGDSGVCVSSDMCGSNGCSGNSMVCVSVVGDGNGLVDGNVVLVNDGGLDNLLDGVDLVGCGNGIGLGNLNRVGFGNMFLNDDFSLNGDGDGNGDLDGVFVDSDFRFDSGHLGSDDSVGPDGSLDFGDGHSVSGCGSLVGGDCGDGSIEGGSGDDRGREGDGVLRSLGGLSNVGVGKSLGDLRVLSVVVSSLDSLGSNLDSSVSNNFVNGLGTCGSSDNMFSD